MPDTAPLTPRARFIAALERRPITGRVPHFELVFYLTMEAFGKVHPEHRNYRQWFQMSAAERQRHREDMAETYLMTAACYEHSAIFLHPNPDTVEETLRLVEVIRERSGDRYFLVRHGDATFSIPDGTTMAAFAYRLADEPARGQGGGGGHGGRRAGTRGAVPAARRPRRVCALRRLLLQHRAVPQSQPVRRVHHPVPRPAGAGLP
ncbi:MAG: hypothetical protein M5R40_11160 [Anaerolineae bacterium]|nr:hypothetical protein [Anaerolineae bacterium]